MSGNAKELVEQILSYMEDGGKDLDSIKDALRVRVLPLLSDKVAPRPEGEAGSDEYARLMPSHTDWEGNPIPTRRRRQQAGDKRKLEIDWEQPQNLPRFTP